MCRGRSSSARAVAVRRAATRRRRRRTPTTRRRRRRGARRARTLPCSSSTSSRGRAPVRRRADAVDVARNAAVPSAMLSSSGVMYTPCARARVVQGNLPRRPLNCSRSWLSVRRRARDDRQRPCARRAAWRTRQVGPPLSPMETGFNSASQIVRIAERSTTEVRRRSDGSSSTQQRRTEPPTTTHNAFVVF